MRFLAISRRLLGRFRFWLNSLRYGRGTTLKTWLGIILSLIVDTMSYSICPLLATSPKVYVSGVIYFKRYDVYFYVRRFSDDLYNVTPRREGDVHELILKSLVSGDAFIDVGANIGYYSILAGKIVGDEGQVIALEPVGDNVKVLNLNINLNNLTNVKVIQKAAWSDSSLLAIYVPEGHYGLSSAVKRHGSKFLRSKAVTLDDVCRAIPTIKLLKIDVEGSEYQALLGAKETLKKTKHIILEISQHSDEIQRMLKNATFKIRKLKFTTHIHALKS